MFASLFALMAAPLELQGLCKFIQPSLPTLSHWTMFQRVCSSSSSLKCPQKCSVTLRSRDSGGKSQAVSTPVLNEALETFTSP